MNRFWDGLKTQRLIDRPTLRLALDETLESQLTLIVAQAGAGKTTLLRQWTESRPDLEFVLIDVNESDDDPAHFARRLTAGIATLHPEVAVVSRAIAPGAAGLCPGFVSALEAALSFLPNIVIIFDNLHRISNVALVSDLGRLIAHTPHNVHCVLSSRVDPPMSLSHHSLSDNLLEIRRSDLAFSLDEATLLLERLAGGPLPPEHVRALWDRTEGWAAGLQLAGLNLRQHVDAGAFVADFGGSDRLVADYLGEEVLASLSAEKRWTLLQLSALDDMSAGLVQAATGVDDAQSLLYTLERESMFLIPLDSDGEWFRFHHLFRELLRSRLRADSPAEELRVITAAADWHLAKGRVKNAMEYLLRAQARDGALEVLLAATVANPPIDDASIETAADGHEVLLPTSIRAEVLTGVRQALAELPADELVRQDDSVRTDPEWWHRGTRPGLGYVAAQVLWRARPEVSPQVARQRLLEVQARCARKPSGRLTRQDAAGLAEALIAGGRAYFLAGNVTEARRWLTHALATAGADVVERVAATSALSLVEAWSGNIQQANALVEETLATARHAGMLSLPSIADASLASVLTALEEDQSSATAWDENQSPPAFSPDNRMLARASTMPGSAPSAMPVPSAMATTMPPTTMPATTVPSATMSTTQSPPVPTAMTALTPTMLFDRALAALDSHDCGAARSIVDTWSELVPAPEPLSVVQNHILRARLADNDDAADEARRQLAEAVRVAEIHGLVDVFVRAGPTILGGLPSVSGPQAAFSAIIVARAHLAVDAIEPGSLPEPLTDREREILSYLPTRFSNVDLAQRFFVSVNTIKTHIAHIYRKLDVANRDAAIRRAQELGIL